MFQIDQAIWNDIEKHEKLKHNFTRVLFLMSVEERDETLEIISDGLEKMGVANSVILSFQVVFPLLLEHEAIQNYLQKPGSSALFVYKDAFPEILDIREAVALMQLEYRLDDEDCALLSNILNKMVEVANYNFYFIVGWFTCLAFGEPKLMSNVEDYSAFKRISEILSSSDTLKQVKKSDLWIEIPNGCDNKSSREALLDLIEKNKQTEN